MINYNLPKTLAVCGREYAIRWDFRAALDICAALSDPELDDQERALTALIILYPEIETMPPEDFAEALKQLIWYLNGGTDEKPNKPRRQLMSWEQDFPLIVGPVSRVLGADVRGMPELHWWSFLGAYMEIGDCVFAQVVAIRAKRARGEKLSREERKFYQENQDLVDLKTHYSEAEEAALAVWAGGKEREAIL